MIGLGVGIDYALFLVTKHRDQMAAGVERHESIARAVATSGGAIVFAGGTVIIALLSLWVADIPLVASLGYASAVAVATAVLAALTLLPAMLSLAGRHLFGAGLPAVLRPRSRPGAPTLWSRWAVTVTAHPLAWGLAALALLISLTVPMFQGPGVLSICPAGEVGPGGWGGREQARASGIMRFSQPHAHGGSPCLPTYHPRSHPA